MTTAAAEIRLIQIGRSSLGLDDDTYRAMLAGLCNGKTSSKALTEPERQKVIAHLKASGFVIKPRTDRASGWQREPQMRKLTAMWYALAEVQAVDRPANADACRAAIEAWAKRQLSTHMPPLDAMRFATGEQMNKLIEEMKRWGVRVGADIR